MINMKQTVLSLSLKMQFITLLFQTSQIWKETHFHFYNNYHPGHNPILLQPSYLSFHSIFCIHFIRRLSFFFYFLKNFNIFPLWNRVIYKFHFYSVSFSLYRTISMCCRWRTLGWNKFGIICSQLQKFVVERGKQKRKWKTCAELVENKEWKQRKK